jgi:hypothetical protein
MEHPPTLKRIASLSKRNDSCPPIYMPSPVAAQHDSVFGRSVHVEDARARVHDGDPPTVARTELRICKGSTLHQVVQFCSHLDTCATNGGGKQSRRPTTHRTRSRSRRRHPNAAEGVTKTERQHETDLALNGTSEAHASFCRFWSSSCQQCCCRHCRPPARKHGLPVVLPT